MRIRTSVIAAVSSTLLLVVGCSTIEHMPPRQGGEAEKITVVKRGVSATTHGFRFLGILPIVFPSQAEAENQVIAQAGAQPHDPDFVLLNEVRQRSAYYLFLFSFHSLTVTADVGKIDH